MTDLALTAAPLSSAGSQTWAYGGSVPGPEVRVRAGSVLRVAFTNDLPEPRADGGSAAAGFGGARVDQTQLAGERDAMWTLVQSLPPKQKAAVVLRFYEDLSEAETARILGVSVGTVKSQTSRAVAHLRERMTAADANAG